jgi:hypothetical protein
LELDNGAAVALAGALVVTGTLNVDAFYSTFGSTLTVGGDLSNSGTVTIGGGNACASTVTIAGALNNSGTVNISDDNTTSPTTATAVSLNNTGTLNLSGSRGGKTTLDLTGGAAPSILASTITLAGNSLLEFASGGISSIISSGKLVLNGAGSFVADASDTTHNSALTGLTSVAGDLELDNGAAVALAGALAVTGTLNVDALQHVWQHVDGGRRPVEQRHGHHRWRQRWRQHCDHRGGAE